MIPIRFVFLLVLLSLVHTRTIRAQNLVPNPSFEQYNRCPSAYSMFYTIDHWIAPNDASTDYMNTCATGTYVGVPVNYFGYQPARTGQGYAGIHPWQDGYNYREYVQVKLKQPLKTGEIYQVEFYVSLSSVFNTALSNLGAYLSVTRPSASNSYGLLDNVNGSPQIRNSSNLMLKDTLNWMKIEGEYKAQGGERYITIGNFDDDANTNYLPSATSPTLSYYYIDDVSVSNCPIETDLGDDRMICPGDTYTLDASSAGATYRWQDGSTLPVFEGKGAGTYWVDVKVATCSFRDSVIVTELKSQYDLLQDVIACPGQYVTLDAYFKGAKSYRWQDGSTQPVFSTYNPGTYWVDVSFANCSFRDSVVISTLESKLAPYIFLCSAETVVLDATVNAPATYTWSNGFTGPILEVKEPGNFQVMIQTAHCEFSLYTQVSDYYPSIFYQDEIYLCSGQTQELNANQYSFFGGPYLWQDGSTDPTFLVNKSGLYWVEVSLNNCTIRDSVRVQFYDDAPPLLPKALTLCQGQTYLLDASAASSSYTYRWQDGSWQSTFLVTKPGTYWVEYYWNQCLVRSTTQVNYFNPIVQLANPDTTLCYGQSRTLELKGENVLYRWPDGSTGSQFTVYSSGTYPLTVQDLASGCTVRRDIRIVSKECWADFYIPNIITPNGDEHNQYFVIEEITDHWGLEIFNRQGNRVYQATAYANNWNGGGHPVGLYYYHLRNPYSGQSFKGWLQVLE